MNRYLGDPTAGLGLCAQLIAQCDRREPHQEHLERIGELINNELLTLVEDTDLVAGTGFYHRMQQLRERLTEIASFPLLERCYTVAVGGAFSAGKSRFLNSVLGCPSLLPTDTTPTTSIPTYISQGRQDRITALNRYGKKTEIDEEALGAICHAFNDRFGVTFSHLLQLVSIERQSLNYSSLAFLDTPGYSKADNVVHRGGNTDETIARQQLRTADYLIWLVDIQNGTIPKQDMEFIASLESRQPVLFIFSKADKKLETQIREVINTARRDLERAELPYLDVIGYSAQTGEEVSDSGRVLSDLLDAINCHKPGTALYVQVAQQVSQYVSDIQTSKQSRKLTLGTMNELLFDNQLSAEQQTHLQDMQQKTKRELDRLTQSEQSAHSCLRALLETLESLMVILELAIDHQPKLQQLTEYRKQSDEQQWQPLSFTALLQGEKRQLTGYADLKRLPAQVKTISPVGVSFESELNLDIIITRQHARTVLGTTPLTEAFIPGTPVELQITSNNKCLVHLNMPIPA
ncbi:GTPase domain-containing protein [Kistimonas scapharcae]|uniref:GTPase domain-containing protein n=1 Tax=Kistimonas scapharcae TaxID=1036133 RepID=UPI0031E52FAD